MPSRPGSRRPLVLVITEPSGERQVPLEGAVLLGRDAECDVVLDHARISRRHCRLTPVDGRLKVTDLGSRNGTFVGGAEICQLLVDPGESINLGGVVDIRVETASRAASPARAPAPQDGGETRISPSPPQPRKPVPQAAARGGGPGLRVVLVLLVIGVMAGGTWVLFSDGGEEAAAALRGRVREAMQEGRPDEALRLLRNLLAEHGDTRTAAEARGLVEGLEDRVARRRETLNRLEDLVTGRTKLRGSRLPETARTIVTRAAGLLTREEGEEWIGRVAEVAEAAAAALLKRTQIAVGTNLRAGNHGLALAAIAEASRSPDLHGSARETLRELQVRVEREAASAYGALLSEIAGATPGEVRRRLRAELFRFEGTVHAAAIRARLRMLDLRPRALDGDAEPDAKAVASAGGEEASPENESLLELLTRVEDLCAQRRYGEALPLLDEAAAMAGEEARGRLRARRARLARLSRLMDVLREQVQAHPGRFRGIRLSPGLEGRVLRANREGIVFSLGAGARASWRWERLTLDHLQSIFARADLRSEDLPVLAELCIDGGAMEAGLSVLGRAWPMLSSADRRNLVPLICEARGIDEPPAAFEWEDGRFLTPEEAAAARLRRRIEDLAGRVAEAAPGEWREPAARLEGLGAEGKDALRTALRRRVQSLGPTLSSTGPFRAGALGATRARLARELEERRKAALELIRDTRRYPYPYGPDQEKVQAEVDERVARVAEIWKTPARWLISGDQDLEALVRDAREVEKVLGRLEPSGAASGVDEILDGLDARLDISAFASSARTRARLERDAEVRSYNASLTEVIRPGEKEVHRLTNDYRVMMGLPALMISRELVLAARGHSQEMKDLGYFAHASPVPEHKTPNQRAKLAGWGGSVSENIARGNRDPAHVLRQWLGSSGHHRNILGFGHTHLGVGCSKDGTFWTQNFGRGSRRPPRRKK